MSLAEQVNHDFYLSQELISVQDKSATREQVLQVLAKKLQEQGLVKDSFYQALLDREQVFPTGLSTQVTGVAIPHTDSQHVNHPALAVATVTKPVQFKAMDNPNKDIDVEIVIMLAVKDSKMQLTMLQRIMQILQNNEVLSDILQASDAGQIKDIIDKYLNS